MLLTVGLIIIWAIALSKIGFNLFGFIAGGVLTFIYFTIVAEIVNSSLKAKGDVYLANKFDEEYKNKN